MKKFVYSVVILLTSLSYAVAQPHFADMDMCINQFMEDVTKEAGVPKKAKHKVIDCSKKGYIIEGLLYKGTLVQNQVMTIKSKDGNIILYGRYSFVNGKNTITGRHQYKIGDKTVSAYGTFTFSNTPPCRPSRHWPRSYTLYICLAKCSNARCSRCRPSRGLPSATAPWSRHGSPSPGSTQ